MKRTRLVAMVLVLCVIPVAQACAGTVIMGKAQAAYLVAHAVTDTVPPSPGVSNWPDVPAGSFCSDEINYCYYYGLIRGEDDGLYHPQPDASRQDPLGCFQLSRPVDAPPGP